jgi:hypothetical protein
MCAPGIAANHALRRTYASEGRAAGVPKDSIRRFLNHSGGDITDHYIRGTALGELQLAEQERTARTSSRPWGRRGIWRWHAGRSRRSHLTSVALRKLT